MIVIKQIKPGLWTIRVHVTPKSGKNQLLPMTPEEDALKVKVTAPPDKGQANTAVIDLLAQCFGVPKSQIEILRGDTSRHKQVGFRVDWDLEQWQNTLASTLHTHQHCFEVLP